MSRGLGKSTLRLRAVVEGVRFEKYPDTPMSCRQVFYQCLGAEVANTAADYTRVCRALVAMRRDGTIDYSRIVDRTRGGHRLPGWDGASEIVSAGASQFRRDMWSALATVPMVACEKQALEGIFAEVVDETGTHQGTPRAMVCQPRRRRASSAGLRGHCPGPPSRRARV